MRGITAQSVCPRYHAAVELIGHRWTGAIIRVLLAGPARFGAIRAAIPDISDRMLSERLRELEAEGVLVRQVTPGVPVRVDYELTEKGLSLEPAIAAIAAWAEQWIPPAPPAGEAEVRTAGEAGA
jgi:DNA-binding HxlR family transcriptional regulator